jgi:hypothetical protein
MRAKLEKIIQKNFDWMMKLKAKKASTKGSRKKFKNKDQNEKQNIWENCNWRTKLNKKNFYKRNKKKIRN